MEWAYPEEIAFMASMALAMDEDDPRIIFYPESRGFQVNVDPSIPLNDPHLLDVVREKAILHRKAKLRRSRQRMRDWREYDPVLHQALLPAIDPSDFLLVRGLSTWLRSAMLTQHMTFTEEAINTLFISMEASFRLVLRTLAAEGINNPTFREATQASALSLTPDQACNGCKSTTSCAALHWHAHRVQCGKCPLAAVSV